MLIRKTVEQLKAANEGEADSSEVTDIVHDLTSEQLLDIMSDNNIYNWMDVKDGPVTDRSRDIIKTVLNHIMETSKEATKINKDLIKLAFIYSAWIGDKDMANTLLQSSSSTGITPSEMLNTTTDVNILKFSPLHMAFKSDNKDMVRYLVQTTKEHDTLENVLFNTDHYHEIALQYGCKKNATDAVKAFLNVLREDKNMLEKVLLHEGSCGHIALHYSTSLDDSGLAEALIDAAKTNQELLEKMLLQGDITDNTPLAEASRNSNTDVVKLLLATSKDLGLLEKVLLQPGEFGCAPLHHCCSVASYHYQMGADIATAHALLDAAAEDRQLLEKVRQLFYIARVILYEPKLICSCILCVAHILAHARHRIPVDSC